MKKIGKIISFIGAIFFILVGLIFLVIEGRMLISLDWSIYEASFNAFIRYFLRTLLALIAIGEGVFIFITIKKDIKLLNIYSLAIIVGLILGTVVLMMVHSSIIHF